MRSKGMVAASRKLAILASAVLAPATLMVWTPGASAALNPVTFAQVTESGSLSDPNVFAYLDNGATLGAELGTDVAGVFGAAVAADFTYMAGAGTLPADLQGVQNATISMTSSTKSPITLYGDGTASEKITGAGQVVDVIKITRSTAAAEGTGTKTNLLTMTFTGKLRGDIGGDTPNISGNTSLGDTVVFSSDFLSFANATTEDYNLAFSSWGQPNPPPFGLQPSATDSFYSTASSASAGTFDFGVLAVSVPEPTLLPLIGAAGLGLLSRRTRRGSSRRAANLCTAAL